MKIIQVKDYAELSRTAARMIIDKVTHSLSFKLGLATGGTPLGLYRHLVEDHRINKTSYRHVKTFNLDEYVGLSQDNKNSYHYYMNKHFFSEIDILPENTNIPNGISVDLSEECNRYERVIEEHGGIDLQILGLGQNGHIGFNEPGTSFLTGTHVVKLKDSTREANSRFFNRIDEVPTHAITMGISTIIKSKEIMLLVSGEKKKMALRRLIEGSISEEFPSSILKKHQKVTIITDEITL